MANLIVKEAANADYTVYDVTDPADGAKETVLMVPKQGAFLGVRWCCTCKHTKPSLCPHVGAVFYDLVEPPPAAQ